MLSYTSSKLIELVDLKLKEDKKNNKKKYIDIFNIAEDFMRRKKLVLYGGIAINYLVPDENKFYDPNDLPDYDVFSVNAKKTAKELADEYSSLGYKFIEVKDAVHSGTYKLSVKFFPIIDITDVSEDFYEYLINYSSGTKNGFIISPLSLIKWSFHFEMASPNTSIHRWLKVYSRMNLFNYNKNKQNKFNEEEPMIIDMQKALDFVKKNNFVITGPYAMYLHGYRDGGKISTLSILLDDINKVKLYKLKMNSISFEMMFQKYEITSRDSFVIKAFAVGKDRCLSYVEIDGYNVATVDTIMAIMYSELIYNLVKKRDASIIINYITKYSDFINNYSDDERFSIKCIGTTKTLIEKMEENWVNNIRTFVYRPA